MCLIKILICLITQHLRCDLQLIPEISQKKAEMQFRSIRDIRHI